MKKMVLFLIVVIIILPLSAVYHKIGEYNRRFCKLYFCFKQYCLCSRWEIGFTDYRCSNLQNPALLGYYDTLGYQYSVLFLIILHIQQITMGVYGLQMFPTLKIRLFFVLLHLLIRYSPGWACGHADHCAGCAARSRGRQARSLPVQHLAPWWRPAHAPRPTSTAGDRA